MNRLVQAVTLGAALSLCQVAVRADVVVSTSLSLTQLQITPSSGSLQFLSPLAASAFAQAQDSLGGSDQQFNSVNGGATSVTASTTLASASLSSSAPLLSATAVSGVTIPEITAFASSASNGGGLGVLSGSFEIVGTTGPVSVQLSALLTGSQSLTTTGGGQSATSEIVFNLLLPDVSGSPLLFYDNPLSIGPNSTLVSPYSGTLTDTVTLMPNTAYSLYLDVDAESSGLNMVPEPSTLALSGGLLCVLGLCRLRRVKGGSSL